MGHLFEGVLLLVFYGFIVVVILATIFVFVFHLYSAYSEHADEGKRIIFVLKVILFLLFLAYGILGGIFLSMWGEKLYGMWGAFSGLAIHLGILKLIGVISEKYNQKSKARQSSIRW